MDKHTIELSKEHIEIMEHTATRAAGGIYCGDSREMQDLIIAGLMESAGKYSFVPDEYFKLTSKGKRFLEARSKGPVFSGEEKKQSLLECPNCQDGLELRYDETDWYEAECSMCNGTGMLDQKKSDGLRKLRACYQKTKKHSNDSNEALQKQ